MNKIDFEVKIFKALAHPVRLGIVKKLVEGELCVCKLQDYTDFSQSNLSQHLRLLKNAGLITSRKEGLFTYYKISDPEVVKLIELVENINKKNIEKVLGV